MSDVPTLHGVVDPPDREGRPFEEAHDHAAIALQMTQERLLALRKQREQINSEIRLLVNDEQLLVRMVRIRREIGTAEDQSPPT